MFKKGAFFKTGNAIFADESVNKSDIVVYVTLCRYANNETGVAYVSRNRIQESGKVGRTAITGALNTLQALGYVSVEKVVAPSGKLTNKYTILR